MKNMITCPQVILLYLLLKKKRKMSLQPSNPRDAPRKPENQTLRTQGLYVLPEEELPVWLKTKMKAFTRWCNSYLQKRELMIRDLRQDLADGIILINLIELLSKKKAPRKWNEAPENLFHKRENLSLVMEMLQDYVGAKTVNIGVEDIVEGNLKIVLALMWVFIDRYQLDCDEAELLEWCKN